MLASHFSVNTFNKSLLEIAKEKQFGLEIEEYLWIYTDQEIKEKQALVSKLMEGFQRFSFHGTAIDRDITQICGLTDDELLALYNRSYAYAKVHGVHKIVFHANYFNCLRHDTWAQENAVFWKRFLENKSPDIKVYIENYIDDTPALLAQLCDLVNDSRLRICFDTGHAYCNSDVPLTDWIDQLGKRIEHVHLHNNDGKGYQHWPLGRGKINMEDIIAKLRDSTNTDAYVLECDFEESLQWLMDHQIIN